MINRGNFWQNPEHSILYINLGATWTWESFNKQMDEAIEMIRPVPHRVDVIVSSDDQSFPFPPGSPVPHFRRLMGITPRNVGSACVVAHTLWTRTALSVLIKISPTARRLLFTADSVDQAIKLLTERQAIDIAATVD
jgi:hypothetical protein